MKTSKTTKSSSIIAQLIKTISMVLLMGFFAHASNKAYIKDTQLDNVRDEIVDSLQHDDEDKVEHSLKIMQELVNAKYTPQRASYLGALVAKMATFSFFPWSKISYADDGSELLDKAIKKAPNDVEVRINRASTYVNFPAMLKKDIILQNDIRWIIKALKENKIPKGAKDSAYKVLSMFFAKNKDEKRYKKYLNKIQNDKYKKAVVKFAKEQ